MRQTLRASALAAAAIALLASTASAQPVGESPIIPLTDWRYDELYNEGKSVRDFIEGNLVYGEHGEEIGDVEDIIFARDGQAISVIAEVGGVWDIGDTHVSVPWDRVIMDNPNDGIRGIIIPVSEEAVEEVDPAGAAILSPSALASVPRAVSEGALIGGGAWRATDLIGDLARLRDGDGYADFGYVNDIFLDGDQVAAVVVRREVAGAPADYALPFGGYGAGWTPSLRTYDLPYTPDELAGVAPFQPPTR